MVMGLVGEWGLDWVERHRRGRSEGRGSSQVWDNRICGGTEFCPADVVYLVEWRSGLPR